MATNNILNEKNVGIQSLVSTGIINGRTLTGTANQVTVNNGDGTGGNPTALLTSTIYVSGISFDSGSNILSVYATGTFSPTVTGSGSNPVVTYATNGQIGNYLKIGTKVIINCYCALATLSGGSGSVQLDALPFTSSATNNAASAVNVIAQTFTLSGNSYLIGRIKNSAIAVNMELCASGSAGTEQTVANTSTTSLWKYSAAYNI